MQVEQVDLTATVASRSNPSSGIASVPAKFRSSDGNTYEECDFPEVAPLIFPALDQLAAQTSADDVKEKTKFAKAYTFVASYWDKRATAEYVSLQSAFTAHIHHCSIIGPSFLRLLTDPLSKGHEKSKQRLSPSAPRKTQLPLRRSKPSRRKRFTDLIRVRRKADSCSELPRSNRRHNLSRWPSRTRGKPGFSMGPRSKDGSPQFPSS